MRKMSKETRKTIDELKQKLEEYITKNGPDCIVSFVRDFGQTRSNMAHEEHEKLVRFLGMPEYNQGHVRRALKELESERRIWTHRKPGHGNFLFYNKIEQPGQLSDLMTGAMAALEKYFLTGNTIQLIQGGNGNGNGKSTERNLLLELSFLQKENADQAHLLKTLAIERDNYKKSYNEISASTDRIIQSYKNTIRKLTSEKESLEERLAAIKDALTPQAVLF